MAAFRTVLKYKEESIMESPSAVWKEYLGLKEKVQQRRPGFAAAKDALSGEVHKDGALSTKVKRLIALAVAIHAGCEICIVGQTMMALERGATRDEILEAIEVAALMGGNTSQSQAYRVIRLLDELGKL